MKPGPELVGGFFLYAGRLSINGEVRGRAVLAFMGRPDVLLMARRYSLPEPTTALPGTPEKVEVLMRRRELRQQLFNKGLDAELPDDLFRAGSRNSHGTAKVVGAQVECNGGQRAATKPQEKVEKSSRFIGVFWHERARKWQAQCKVLGVTQYLGLHDTEEQAARARQAWLMLMGEGGDEE